MNLQQNVTPMTCLVFLSWWLLRIAAVALGFILGNLTGQLWVTVVVVVVGFVLIQVVVRRLDAWQLNRRDHRTR
jgi:uncharacterized membrane protein